MSAPTPAQVLEDLQAAAWAQGRAMALEDPDAPNPYRYLPDGEHRERVDMVVGLSRCPLCAQVHNPQVSVPAWIRSRHKAGWTMADIARRLNEAAIPPLGGGAKWHPATVRFILNRQDVLTH